jgi:hypothetical protein
MELLNKIQQELKAPKGQFNSFGEYKYRNCEDILEAVKPLLGEGTLVLSDEIVHLGDRFYVRAKATVWNGLQGDEKRIWSAEAYAREAFNKKGMDEAQITGAASSYARKYALNGLFCIDDTKDADSDEKEPEKKPVQVSQAHVTNQKPAGKLERPNSVKNILAQKIAIKNLCDDIVDGIGVPLQTAEDYAVYVEEQTGLTLEAHNYQQIIERLKAKQ